MGALHAACLKSAADGPEAGRYTDFSAQGAGYKNYEKNRFSLQQLPKKGHFLNQKLDDLPLGQNLNRKGIFF